MEIVKINISELTPYENNAKKHTKAQIKHIKNSITEYGFNDPIGVYGDNNIIVEGHGRYEALKQLGYEDVPCIRLDHLTDEQRKEYTIAHNSINLETGFDFTKLRAEMEDFKDKFKDFGLNFDKMNKPEKPKDYKQQRNLENFFKMQYDYENEWGIPTLEPFGEDLTDIQWLPFSHIKQTGDLSNSGVHFYIDDYQFQRVWSNSDEYIPKLQQCRAVVTPDFSNYTDMPKAMHLWSQYKRQWLGLYWQTQGINVIPSLSWGQGQIWDFTFMGIPQNSILATSLVGTNIDKDFATQELLKVAETLNPIKLLIKASDKAKPKLRELFNCDFIDNYKWRGKHA